LYRSHMEVRKSVDRRLSTLLGALWQPNRQVDVQEISTGSPVISPEDSDPMRNCEGRDPMTHGKSKESNSPSQPKIEVHVDRRIK
jgi:hypothetical protein